MADQQPAQVSGRGGGVGLMEGQATAADDVTVSSPGDTDASALLQQAIDSAAGSWKSSMRDQTAKEYVEACVQSH